MRPSSDPLSTALVELIQEQGYAVEVSPGDEGLRAVATHSDGRIAEADGSQPYLLLCALAVKVRFARPHA